MNNELKNYLDFVESVLDDENKQKQNNNIDQSNNHTPVLFDKPEAEEPEGIDVIEEAERVFFIEQLNITSSSPFTPKAANEDQDNLPIHGLGRLDNLIIISNSSSYDVNVAVDNRDVVEDSYDTLSSISNELEHVSAYSRNNQFIVVVTDYPFEEGLHITIRPRDNITFHRVRVEGVIENGIGRDF